MPRRLLKKITPHPEKLQNRWFLKLFGSRVADPRLWSLQRRSVTAAFATGLAICFVPLPIHLPLAALLAIVARLNVPTIVGTVLLVNPVTVVPVFYTAYRVGCAVLDVAPQRFTFEFSFDWLQNGLGPMWEPFLLGCLICAGLAALTGWVGLELLWRWQVRSKYRARRLSSMS
ncbi:MAG TPA: DUF2062 domain-containing protein [Steroidobacteraceae bacterium]|nr:DUF2062 domain-containing protein [Steroidobacteraceae bacterium]